ncbi:MAG: protecting protein DprA protein [candidate division TM6 bacterium GW2011_GWE2_41_16]|nr:MAG: protecting protein DprA protein [candidate division TM6 bacterium GW2011_GWE2_41_16]
MNARDRFLLHCSLIDGVGPATLAPLIDFLHTHDDALVEQFYAWGTRDFCALGISQARAEFLVHGLADMRMLEAEEHVLQKSGAVWVSRLSGQYSQLLAHIHQPPIGLYVYGCADVLNIQNTVACIGSRKADRYGFACVDKIIRECTGTDVCIVSGGARGIDTSAHQHALRTGLKTIAVLGSGLCRPYPKENNSLFDQIIDAGGAVISSFGLEQEARPDNFPARNRIIAGMSRVTLVFQAAAKSGALITARYALDEGRDVCAVPGQIDNPLSEGCHELIAQGAQCVHSGSHILNLLGVNAHRKISNMSIFEPVEKECVSQTNMSHSEQIAYPADSDEAYVYAACKTPQFFDQLMALGRWSCADTLRAKLYDLSFDGVIEQDFMGRWSRVTGR